MELKTSASVSASKISALWALDPSEQKLLPHISAIEEVRHMLGGFANAHPVYVCSDEKVTLEAAVQQVQKFLQPLDLGPTAPVEVFRSSGKKADETVPVLKLAHEQGAQVILLTSHGRSAIGEALLGSFARELLKKSDIPVLFLSPRPLKSEEHEKALFATDFSPGSKAAFLRFLDFVKVSSSEVVLCHIVNFPMQTFGVAEGGGAAGPALDKFLQDQKVWAEQEAKKWIADPQVQKAGVKVRNLVGEAWASPATALAKIADHEKINLLGLVSHSGPVEGLLLGSVTHDLLSSQRYNLWMCGPKFVSLFEKESH